MTLRSRILVSCLAVALPSFGCSGSTDTPPLSGSCVTAPQNDISISSVSIPGQGIWPEELVPTARVPGAADRPPSGTGCDWIDGGYAYYAQSLHCSGLASVAQTADDGELTATFEGGAVARFSMPGAVLPASGELQLDLALNTRKSNPYGGLLRSTSSVARDASGLVVWLVAATADEQLAELVGAPIQAVASCRTRFDDCLGVFDRTVFDQVVHTTPEQRIVAGEPTLIDTPNGAYLISWYSAELEQVEEHLCSDADFPRSGSGVRALLQR